MGRYLWRGRWWPDGGLREAEFAQITRTTLFDVSWPQGGKLGTLSGAKPRARVVAEEIIFIKTASCSLPVALGVCDPGGVNQRIRLAIANPCPSNQFIVKPSLSFSLFSHILPPVLRQCTLTSFLPSSPCHGENLLNTLHSACTSFLELTLLNIGDVKHTVLQIRLRRSLHRDTLFASRRKVSMGAHLYRRTRRRHTATYAFAKTAFEADISS